MFVARCPRPGGSRKRKAAIAVPSAGRLRRISPIGKEIDRPTGRVRAHLRPRFPKAAAPGGALRSGALQRRAAGITFVEMLVVFVILGLVTTLLFQATAFFASRYETVQRLHREGAMAGLQQHWFITTVQALVPYGRETRRFRGNEDSFSGVTLQPLLAEPGMPADAQWFIDERGGSQTVYYREEPGPHRNGVEWPVLTTDAANIGFQYADTNGQWRRRWPVDDAPTDWLPRAIRLVTPEQGTLWVARIDPSPAPVLTEEDLR